jgi:hypothetical protein
VLCFKRRWFRRLGFLASLGSLNTDSDVEQERIMTKALDGVVKLPMLC